MLRVRNLHVRYGHIEAVRGVDLDVEPGRITLVLGANGAGKTTTLKAIAGLEPPAQGTVHLNSEDITGLPPHHVVRRGLVLVPEGRRVFAPLSVSENLRIGAYTVDRSRAGETLKRVHEMFPILAERANSPAGLLSGGEQQMLAFGRALMAEPKVMLMDEPSMGLAPAVVDMILTKVRMMADSGLAVLMVEQNAEASLRVADSVVAMARGEVVFSGSAEEARNSVAVLRAFLGETALAEG